MLRREWRWLDVSSLETVGGKTYVTRETAPRTKSAESLVGGTILDGLVVRLEELEISSGAAKSKTQLDLV